MGNAFSKKVLFDKKFQLELNEFEFDMVLMIICHVNRLQYI